LVLSKTFKNIESIEGVDKLLKHLSNEGSSFQVSKKASPMFLFADPYKHCIARFNAFISYIRVPTHLALNYYGVKYMGDAIYEQHHLLNNAHGIKIVQSIH
jgi:hypothetical protein